MTIEITKKQLIIIGAIAALIFFAGGGYTLYSFGYSSGYKEGHYLGYSEGHYSGVKETTQKYENPKGNGYIWYAESINNGNDYLYHSTSICPNIRNGIIENCGFANHNYRKQHSQFCPKCMDAYLIRMCQAFLYTNKNWK